MSCTSYKEVLDPKQAVKELSGKLSSPTCTIILVSLEIKFGDSPQKKNLQKQVIYVALTQMKLLTLT